MQVNFTTAIQSIIQNIEQVIIGKREAIELALCAYLCRGHVLIEDMPGVGKTSLVSAIAKSFDCSFRRIQFTPDIMPSDITGFSMFNQKLSEFEYRPGSIMAQIVLADEINRASPKTQSALLEVMEENQVTVDGITYAVPQPFIVYATQNPIEYIGTYPLPEAQLDRFFMRISLGYPTAEEESHMLERYRGFDPLDSLVAVSNDHELKQMQEFVPMVHVDSEINQYIVTLIQKTRTHPHISLGASPRASLNLYRGAQAWALCNERSYVIPDDVIKMLGPVVEHRLVLNQEAKLRHISSEHVIQNILSTTKVPK